MGVWEFDVQNLEKKVKEWTPPEGAASEKDCEGALSQFLHDQFPHEVFDRQYKQGKTSADLRVKLSEDKVPVAIELKLNLVSRAEYHRLLGQIWTYVDEWEHEVLVVLCGNCEAALSRRVERFAKFLTEWKGKKVCVVQKGALKAGVEAE